jgi:hypothetical protein
MPTPPDTSGGKSIVQGVGSTNSYLRRYIACNIFNIVVVGDDDDATGGTLDEAQTNTIVDLIKRAKVGPKFLKYMRAQSIAEAGSLETALATRLDRRSRSGRLVRNRSRRQRSESGLHHRRRAHDGLQSRSTRRRCRFRRSRPLIPR